ncbi:MAG TPA: ribose-5-phosphate isomerase RpiA [Steroidobacteraceae bacterium]|nr:ribose-5-phosphate isomerase RpiA [Steroidobacteraceae bacterium]
MSTDSEQAKRNAARAALDYLESGTVLGVGTGSTVNLFIEILASHRDRVHAAVSSSNASTERLKAAGIQVLDLNIVTELGVYVDGADEATRARQLIKGGGGALTREKIVAAAAARFVCIADESKLVDRLGAFPLPIEVIPMARSLVTRTLQRRGARPMWRKGFVTDNGNDILDVSDLKIDDPPGLERELNQIAGVVTVGLFAIRPADVLILGSSHGVEIIS